MSHELWNELAGRAGRSLTDEQRATFDRYLDLLLQANQRMNLTRLVDRQQAAVGHVGDALTLLPWIPAGPLKLIDIGSGGGVPGIPLAIALPEAQVMLVESTQKKAAFLRDCVRELKLSNVEVCPQRAEEAGRSPLRGRFDVATARAVGELSFLVEWCMPLLVKGGRLLAMKGAKAREEIASATAALRTLNAAEPVVHSVELPGTENHVILEVIKLGQTPATYPRPATIAKSRPIGRTG